MMKEPVIIRRQKRELGVFLPMALYRKLVAGENRKITQAMDRLNSQVEGLSESVLEDLLNQEIRADFRKHGGPLCADGFGSSRATGIFRSDLCRVGGGFDAGEI